MSYDESEWFERPVLDRDAPKRGAGNYYRASADRNAAAAKAGVPLSSPEAAVVAAVRLAYKVAEAQIDRSARLARRLRRAGDDAAGPGSDRQALDATERLVFKAMMTGLSWLEGAASNRGNPLKRLVVAEYRLLGAMLGLAPSEEKKSTDEQKSGSASATENALASALATVRTAARAWSPENAAPRSQHRAAYPLRIKHDGKERRAVHVRNWEIAANAPAVTYKLTFYSAERSGGSQVGGSLALTAKRSAATLSLTISRRADPGCWRAVICDPEGIQLGHVEIEI